jgi:hypothetical protein
VQESIREPVSQQTQPSQRTAIQTASSPASLSNNDAVALDLLERVTQRLRISAQDLVAELPQLGPAQLPEAIAALSRAVVGQFEVLRPYLDHPEAAVAAAAVTALAKLDPHFALDFLLADPRPLVRMAAARVSQDRRMVSAALDNEKAPAVQRALRIALERLG